MGKGQSFTLNKDDRKDLVDNILNGDKSIAKAVEDFIAYYFAETSDNRRRDQARTKSLESVIGKARELEQALDELDGTDAIRFIGDGIKLGTLKQELEKLAAIEPPQPKRGRPRDKQNFDLLVAGLKQLLIDNDFTVSTYRDNILNKLVDFALRVIDQPREDSLNQIRAYLGRYEKPPEENREEFLEACENLLEKLKYPEFTAKLNEKLKKDYHDFKLEFDLLNTP